MLIYIQNYYVFPFKPPCHMVNSYYTNIKPHSAETLTILLEETPCTMVENVSCNKLYMLFRKCILFESDE